MKTLSGFIVVGAILCSFSSFALAGSSTTTRSFTVTARIPPVASLPIFPQNAAVSLSEYQKIAQKNTPAIITQEERILPDMRRAVLKSVSVL